MTRAGSPDPSSTAATKRRDPDRSQPDGPARDGLDNPIRTVAMLAIMFGLGLAAMDGLIATIALPVLGKEFGVAPSAATWVVNAYQFALVGALLPCASLGELYGYRRVYLLGLAVFALTSIACATAHSLAALVAARALQGVGAAAVFGVNSALVRHIWPRAQLGRGLGFNAAIAAGGFAMAPMVASAVLSVADWTWLFILNIPLTAAAIALSLFALPKVAPRAGTFDVVSALLTAGMFAAAAFGAKLLSDSITSAAGVALIAGAVLLGGLVWRRESRLKAPLFPVDLLRIPLFRSSVLTSICSFCAASLALIALPFFLQTKINWPAAWIGFAISPWPIATALTAPISGRVADRYPPGPLGAIGMVGFAAALVLMTALDAAVPVAVAGCLIVCGVGFGLFQTSNNRALIGAAPMDRSGGASGMLGISRTVGLALGGTVAAGAFHVGRAGALLALRWAILSAVVAAVFSLVRGGQRPD